MSFKFYNLRICYIVAFELDLNEEMEINYHLLKENTFLGEYPSFKLKSLSDDIYEKDFVRLNPKIPTFELEFKGLNIFDIFKEDFKKENMELEFNFLSSVKENLKEIKINFCFDQCGICSATFDFSFHFKNSIETSSTIKILTYLCGFVDEILFPKYLKLKIETIVGINHKAGLLKEHATYPVICSTDIYNTATKENETYEIFGILWMDEEYNSYSKDIVNEITRINIAPHKGDILTISTTSSLIIFKGIGIHDNYVNERINAIEIFCRQEYLLKKLDIKLDSIIREYKKTDDLKSVIKEIRSTQIDIQSSLEFYRNTKISVTLSFNILFDTLNNVFGLDKYYKVVNEKLNVCENLYRSSYEERRNQLTENIQWIVVLLGFSSLIVATLNLFKDSNLAVILVAILLLVLLIIQLKKPGKIKKAILCFVHFINK